jgi:hypothetical protein
MRDRRNAPKFSCGLQISGASSPSSRPDETLPPWQGIGKPSSFKMEHFSGQKSFFPVWDKARSKLVKPPFPSLFF